MLNLGLYLFIEEAKLSISSSWVLESLAISLEVSAMLVAAAVDSSDIAANSSEESNCT